MLVCSNGKHANILGISAVKHPAWAALSIPGVVQGKWQSLKEAADAYSELSEYARREKQWLLQRVRHLFPSIQQCCSPPEAPKPPLLQVASPCLRTRYQRGRVEAPQA